MFSMVMEILFILCFVFAVATKDWWLLAVSSFFLVYWKLDAIEKASNAEWEINVNLEERDKDE